MTEPEKEQSDTETHLHAGPREEGGHGGMATREAEANEAQAHEAQAHEAEED